MSALGGRKIIITFLFYDIRFLPRLQVFKVCLNSLISIIRDIFYRQRYEDQESYTAQHSVRFIVFGFEMLVNSVIFRYKFK